MRQKGDYQQFDSRYTYPVIKDTLEPWLEDHPNKRLTVEQAYDLMDSRGDKPIVGKTGQYHFTKNMKEHVVEKAQREHPELFRSPSERRWAREPVKTERNLRRRYRIRDELQVFREDGKTYVAGPGYKRALTIREYQQRVKAGKARQAKR